MKNKLFKRFTFKSIIALFMLLSLVFQSAVVSAALSFNGSTSSGGSDSTTSATGGYSIGANFVGDQTGRVAGYRFSIVDSSGAQQFTPLDLIRYSTCSAENKWYGGTGWNRLSPKLPKTGLKAAFTYTSFTTTTSTSNVKYDNSLGLNLPEYTTGIEDFSYNEDNIKPILNYFTSSLTLEVLAENDWSILIEPLFPLTIENIKCVLTPTEIAVYGASKFGIDTTIKSSSTQDTWDFIAKYTNLRWPNSMRLEVAHLGMNGVSESTSYLSFRKIIEQGYGAVVLFPENTGFVPPTYTNNIYHWVWGFQNKEGNNGAKTAFKIGSTTFNVNYGSTYTMSVDKALSIPNGFYVTDFSSNSITGSYVRYDIGTKVTQKAAAMNFEYNYRPYNYTITYNLGGGTNHSSNPDTYNVLYGVSLEAPTRDGYIFSGWHDGTKIITGINEGATATFSSTNDLYNKLASRRTGDITLTAQWTPKTYTVNYEGNGSTAGSTASSSYTFDVAKELTANGYYKTGYKFMGWNTRPDGSGTSYADKALVKNLSSVDGDVITLYAQWAESSSSSSTLTGHLRFIKKNYTDTLLSNSKWRTDPLKEKLQEVFDYDFKDTSSCEQVWHFSAEEFEDVQKWCREHEKGTETNKAFLDEYTESNRKQ